jgi:hypothetical protein
MAAAHIESGRRPIAKRLIMLRRVPWALALSATLSVVFVVFVAALIAFMQYQARLLRSQPGVTASQLVYYVDTEKKLEEEQSDLTELSKRVSVATPRYTLTSFEIDYRIERICALFDAGPDAKTDTDKCSQFLHRIPFAGTVKTSTAGLSATPDSLMQRMIKTIKTPTNGSSPPADAISISADLLSGIMANFTELMGEKKFGDVEFTKLVSLFQSDFSIIARLNQDYWLQIRPNYLNDVALYSATCQHLIDLINIVSSYRTIDHSCDPHTADKFAEPAKGGAIILPAKPSGNQPGAPQRPPAAGEAADAAANINADQAASINQAPLPSDTLAGAQQPGNAVTPGGPPVTLPSAQRMFELVTHYRFYDRISFGKLRDILISPNDFLALVLVCVGGVLGALLRIVFSSYISGKDPTLRSVVISPILGLICALVIYNLFRAGFIIITDQPQNGETAGLSPFVIALLAMAAGLLSERTIEFFRKTSDNWLGSVEAGQSARWGVNLQREMDAQATTAEKLAERLDISTAKLKDWAQEKEPVPNDKQREIAFALNVPLRRIFTDLEPSPTG